MLRHDSPIMPEESHHHLERALSQRNVPTISLTSAFSSGAYHAPKSSEVVFFAGEDIFRDSIVGTRELAIKKYCKCKFDLDDSRTFESFCFEFCGLLNVRLCDIKFMIGRKEVVMGRNVKKSCEILVSYNKFVQARGVHNTQMSDYALGPAYSSLLETGLFSDIEIKVNGETLKAHKCILTARSEKFNVMLLSEATTDMAEQKLNKLQIEDKHVTSEIFKEMLRWLYVGECEVSHNAGFVLPLL